MSQKPQDKAAVPPEQQLSIPTGLLIIAQEMRGKQAI